MALVAQRADATEWHTENAVTLSSVHLRALFDNRVPAIRVRGAIGAQACAALAKRVDAAAALAPYAGQSMQSGIYKIGPMQTEFTHGEEDGYAAALAAAQPLWTHLYEDMDPVQVVHRLLRSRAGVTETLPRVAVLQNIERAMELHADFAALDAQGWQLSQVNAQVAWLVHLRAPTSGGETRVYNRPWQPRHETLWRVADAYNYDDAVVHGAPVHRLPFCVGDLVLFNSRNYHRVPQTRGGRLTVGAFLGRLPDGTVCTWT